jgi:hypothetical protein
MENIPEINLTVETKKVGQYNIDDMVKMFGNRIKFGIYYENNKPYALICKKMSKICKKWKFWNKDIRKAYKNYSGYILAPYIIINKPAIINCDISNKSLSKEILLRYSKTEFYQTTEKL